MEKFNEILDALAANKIKYTYHFDGRGQTKYIYIHKKDAGKLPKI